VTDHDARDLRVQLAAKPSRAELWVAVAVILIVHTVISAIAAVLLCAFIWRFAHGATDPRSLQITRIDVLNSLLRRVLKYRR